MAARPRFEQFFAIRRFGLLGNLDFSPDSSEVSYAHDGSGQYNLWRSPVEGGWPTQLTALEESAARHHAWTPHGFLIAADHHGDEMWQINRLPSAGGWPEDLTRRPEQRHEMFGKVLSDDGARICFSANRTAPTDMGIHVLHIPDGEIQPVLEEPGNWYATAWHPDGRHLLGIKLNSNTDQDIFLIDIHGSERRLLSAHEGEEVNAGLGFAADGKGFYRITNSGHEFSWLAYQPLDGGPLREIVKTNWDVEHTALSGDRRRLAFTLNEGGVSTFHMLDLENSRELAVPALPSGACLQFALSRDGTRIAAVIGSGTLTNDLHVADLQKGRSARITQSFLGGIPESDLVEPELVQIPSFDGRSIPAWLYRPREAAATGPALLSIHGGPEAQERPGNAFSFYQYLLSRGVAILAPNIRGSTGYGITYQSLIHRDWGGDELKDIEACARYLQGLDFIDGNRLGVYGGSFGGFATLSAMTRLPQYWACGLDLVGPANLVTFAKAVPPHWRAMMTQWVGDPYTEENFLMSRSPISYVDQIRAPLMVLQGAMDPRVVKAESDQMVERLRRLGRDVEYHVFEDEGHGFTKRANQQRAMKLGSDFLFKHLEVTP